MNALDSSRKILDHYADRYCLDEPVFCWEEASHRHDALAYYVRTLAPERQRFFTFLEQRFGRAIHPQLAPDQALRQCGPLSPAEEDEVILDFVDHCRDRAVLRELAARLALWCRALRKAVEPFPGAQAPC